MKNVNVKKNYVSYVVETHEKYLKLIKLILKNTDEVCFTVTPFLDNLEEFNNSIWSFLNKNVIYTTIDRAITDSFDEKSHLIILRNDYFLYQFFLNKKNIFDFEESDENLGITLENPVFIKDGEVVCYTLTHEKFCDIEESLYLQLEK